MKKLLFLLVFIPLVSFSQTYKDLMSIKSVDMFKKVVIENNYEFAETNDETVTYGYNIQKDSINGDKATKWAMYGLDSDMFFFTFSRNDVLSNFFGMESDNSENSYDLILKDVKEKCTYYKVETMDDIEYLTYSCPESTYKGKLGFAVQDGWGFVMHIPPYPEED